MRPPLKLLAALAAAAFLAAADAPPHLLREQAWTAPGPSLAHDLTHAPGECLAQSTPEIEAGRALFRSPALLGGPAARAGLSCNACHADGRVNARFLLPELTDRAGAADVTSEWSSRIRGDGVLNPVEIPDLTGAGQRTAFGHALTPSLEAFIRSVVEEEFQGAHPSETALSALVAYVRALDPAACAPEHALTLASAASDVRRALAAAEAADPETARFVLLAAQDAMGRLAERLPAQRFAAARTALAHLALELGALREARDIAPALQVALPGWRARFDAEIAALQRQEARTYFNERTLARDLGNSQ